MNPSHWPHHCHYSPQLNPNHIRIHTSLNMLRHLHFKNFNYKLNIQTRLKFKFQRQIFDESESHCRQSMRERWRQQKWRRNKCWVVMIEVIEVVGQNRRMRKTRTISLYFFYFYLSNFFIMKRINWITILCQPLVTVS